ncbi:MAG: hypothetical protein K0Q72_2652 [Armatimonadetes bacterium]|nr:hypothetical protein [Armatimonadota bacterium]
MSLPYESLLHLGLFQTAERLAADPAPDPGAMRAVVLGLLEVIASGSLPTTPEALAHLQRCVPAQVSWTEIEGPFQRAMERLSGNDRTRLAEWLALARVEGSMATLRALSQRHGSAWLVAAPALTEGDLEALEQMVQLRAVNGFAIPTDLLQGLLTNECRRPVLTALRDRATGSRDRVALAAAELLEALGGPDDHLFCGLLHSDDPRVRDGAAYRLLASPFRDAAMETLVAFMTSLANFGWRVAIATKLLATEAWPAAEAALLLEAASGEPLRRTWALNALRESPRAHTAENALAADELCSPDPEIRYDAAVKLLGTRYHRRALAALLELAVGEHEYVHHNALLELQHQELDEAGLGLLVPLLVADDFKTRWHTANVLKERGYQEAAEAAVLSCIGAPDLDLRSTVLEALLTTRHRPEAEAGLRHLMEEGPRGVREIAAGRLLDGPLGPVAEAFLAGELQADEPARWNATRYVLHGRQLGAAAQQSLAIALVRREGRRWEHFWELISQQEKPSAFLAELERLLRAGGAWPPDVTGPDHPLHVPAWVYATLAIRVHHGDTETRRGG